MTEASSKPITPENPHPDQPEAAVEAVAASPEPQAGQPAGPDPEPAESSAEPTPELPGSTSPAKRFFPLDPRSIRVEQLTGLIIFAVLAVGALIGLTVSFFAGGQPTWIWWTVAGGVVAGACLLLFFTLSWPAWEHRYARWTWDADGLEIHRGVFWQHRISVPISRIQHVDVSQGPLQRQFGLGKVTVHTAGTQHAAIELSGIAYEAAVWVREQIIAGQGGPDAV